MKLVSLTDFRRRLSFFLVEVKRGKSFVLTERGVPIAKIVPLKKNEKLVT